MQGGNSSRAAAEFGFAGGGSVNDDGVAATTISLLSSSSYHRHQTGRVVDGIRNNHSENGEVNDGSFDAVSTGREATMTTYSSESSNDASRTIRRVDLVVSEFEGVNDGCRSGATEKETANRGFRGGSSTNGSPSAPTTMRTTPRSSYHSASSNGIGCSQFRDGRSTQPIKYRKNDDDNDFPKHEDDEDDEEQLFLRIKSTKDVTITVRQSDTVAQVKHAVLIALGLKDGDDMNGKIKSSGIMDLHDDQQKQQLRDPYVRLIASGRLLTPDHAAMEKFRLQSNDVVHAVVAKQRGAQALIARGSGSTNAGTGSGRGVRGGSGGSRAGSGGGGSVNTMMRQMMMMNHHGGDSDVAAVGANPSTSSSFAAAVLRRQRQQQRALRGTGIDESGWAVRRDHRHDDEDEDDEEDSGEDFEDDGYDYFDQDLEYGNDQTHGRESAQGRAGASFAAVGRQQQQQRRRRTVADGGGTGNRRAEQQPPHRRNRRQQQLHHQRRQRRRQHQRIGFDRLRNAPTNLRRSEVTAIRTYFSRYVDRWMQQHPELVQHISSNEDDLVRRRAIFEDAWMMAQGPHSEFSLNVGRINLFDIGTNTADGNEDDTANENNNQMDAVNATASTASPFMMALSAPARNGNNGSGGNGTNGADPGTSGGGVSGDGNASGNTALARGVSNQVVGNGSGSNNPSTTSTEVLLWRNGGISATVGTHRDFIWGFTLGFLVGSLMLIWVWMPTVPHKQKLGILTCICAHLLTNMFNKNNGVNNSGVNDVDVNGGVVVVDDDGIAAHFGPGYDGGRLHRHQYGQMMGRQNVAEDLQQQQQQLDQYYYYYAGDGTEGEVVSGGSGIGAGLDDPSLTHHHLRGTVEAMATSSEGNSGGYYHYNEEAMADGS